MRFGYMATDEQIRRYVEALGDDVYNTLTYYQRWTAALSRQMVDKGILWSDDGIVIRLPEAADDLEEEPDDPQHHAHHRNGADGRTHISLSELGRK